MVAESRRHCSDAGYWAHLPAVCGDRQQGRPGGDRLLGDRLCGYRFGYLAWRRPRLTGGLLVAFAPIGFGLGALGGLGAAIWFAGVPLVSGLLLIVASLWRKRPTFTSSL